MNYSGKLYGKVDRTYIPLRLTSEDVDRIEAELKTLRSAVTKLKTAKGRHHSEIAARELFQMIP